MRRRDALASGVAGLLAMTVPAAMAEPEADPRIGARVMFLGKDLGWVCAGSNGTLMWFKSERPRTDRSYLMEQEADGRYQLLGEDVQACFGRAEDEGLEYEFADQYQQHRARGDDPGDAAIRACWDWDL